MYLDATVRRKLVAAFPAMLASIDETLSHYDDVLRSVSAPDRVFNETRRRRVLHDTVHGLGAALREWQRATAGGGADPHTTAHHRTSYPSPPPPSEHRYETAHRDTTSPPSSGSSYATSPAPASQPAAAASDEPPRVLELTILVAKSGETFPLRIAETATAGQLLQQAATAHDEGLCDAVLYAHDKPVGAARELRSCALHSGATVIAATDELRDAYHMGMWLVRSQLRATLQQVVVPPEPVRKAASESCMKLLFGLDALEADTDAKRADRKAEVKHVQALLDVLTAAGNAAPRAA